MTTKSLIEELKQLPADSQVHVIVNGEPQWYSVFTVFEDSDPGGGRHAVLSVYPPVMPKEAC